LNWYDNHANHVEEKEAPSKKESGKRPIPQGANCKPEIKSPANEKGPVQFAGPALSKSIPERRRNLSCREPPQASDH
jgi:hypothetical protein